MVPVGTVYAVPYLNNRPNSALPLILRQTLVSTSYSSALSEFSFLPTQKLLLEPFPVSSSLCQNPVKMR